MNLAIKGHETRGAEVIEILEMLGGINVDNLYGDDTYDYYTITYDKEIAAVAFTYIDGDTCIFTLEEFEEKYPYKVGDKVQLKKSASCGSVFEVEKMRWVEQTGNIEYTIKRLWYNNCRVTASVENLQPYKEETMEEQKQIPPYMDYDIRTEENIEETIKIDIPKGYEFFGIDDDNKVVLTKKQFQYPKTYEECCKVLGADPSRIIVLSNRKDIIHEENKHCFEMYNLYQLFICRGAYWKIAGEEIGLGKPWKPDYHEKSYEQGSPIKYVIYYTGTHITKERKCTPSYILAFPTEEMRNAFFDNFKDLIEECKELL